MNITPQSYSKMSEKVSPRSNSAMNTLSAFCVGGGICAVGQIIRGVLMHTGMDTETAGLWTSVILIAASSLLTGLGIYQRIAKHAGSGTLVPITGFSNAISSEAIESQSEGFILGIGTKIFTIAGPVILYGSAASAVYGLIYWLLNRFS